MRKTAIYLDTSFISYLEQEDAPEKMRETNELWLLFKYRDDIDLLISNVTFEEINKCAQKKKVLLLERMSENLLRYVEETIDDIQLANLYLTNNVLTNKSLDDLRHISIAVNNGCRYILSWNFKHFVNPKTINAVNAINKQYNLHEIHILPPSMMLGGF